MRVRILAPADRDATQGFDELYATGSRVDALLGLGAQEAAPVYAALLFSEEGVNDTRAEFFGGTYYELDASDSFQLSGAGREVYVPPEGKIIMLFTKAATG